MYDKIGKLCTRPEHLRIWIPKESDDLALNPCTCGCKEPVYEEYLHEAGPRWRIVCPECGKIYDPGYAQDRAFIHDMWNDRRVMESQMEVDSRLALVGESDRCVICGDPVYEGRQVCWACEHQAENIIGG